MKSLLALVPFLALFTLTSAQAEELRPFCDGSCWAELTLIMSDQVGEGLADYSTTDETTKMVADLGSKSRHQDVRLKAIEILMRAGFNLNRDFRMAALAGVAKVAQGSRDEKVETAALKVLGTSVNSSYSEMSKKIMEDIGSIAVKSPHFSVKDLALKQIEEVTYDKKAEKRDKALFVGRQIEISKATMTGLRFAN